MAPVCSNCGGSDFVWANDLKTGMTGGGSLSLRARGEIPIGTRVCRACGHADLFLRDISILHQPHLWRPGEFVPIVAKPAAKAEHRAEPSPPAAAPSPPAVAPPPPPPPPAPAPPPPMAPPPEPARDLAADPDPSVAPMAEAAADDSPPPAAPTPEESAPAAARPRPARRRATRTKN